MFNRIQKLLKAEYSNFHELVLFESPFAQLSKHMKGIRAVQIALTEKNLIIASDIFLHELQTLMVNQVDAEVDTLELLQIIPLKFLEIKLSRKGLHDKFYMKVIYKRNPQRVWRVFEFGGHFMKHFFWEVWSERLREMRERREIFENSSMENLCEKINETQAESLASLSVEEMEEKTGAESEEEVKNEIRNERKS